MSRRLGRRAAIAVAGAMLLIFAGAIGPAPGADAPGIPHTWGSNPFGQLGDGSFDARFSIGAVPGLDDVIDLHGGRGHVVALRAGGTVVAWGRNNVGQVGDGTTVDRPSPREISGLTDVAAVSAGHYHSMALLDDGTVSTWGFNADGQLGDGTTMHRSRPVAVSNLDGVVAIAAGRNMSFAVRNDGSVWAWGRNDDGQLGDGTRTSRTRPVRVSTIDDAVAVAGGRDHALALTAAGTVWAWGDNTYGQLGDGTSTDRLRPVTVAGPGEAVSVSAGAHHSYALLDDGSIASWGRNYRGQLGDGTTRLRRTPVAVDDIDDAVEIGTGRDHGLAILADGTVRSWGWNDFGQLGDGTTATRTSPVGVPGADHGLQVHGGQDFSVLLQSGTAPDTTPPTRPGRPTGQSAVAGTIDLEWAASTDDRSTLLEYRVIRDGQLLTSFVSAATTVVAWRDSAVAPGTAHSYRIIAVDEAGNRSALGAESAPIRERSPMLLDDFGSGDFALWSRSWRLSIDETRGDPTPPSARADVSNQKAFARFTLPQPVTSVCVSSSVSLAIGEGRGVTVLRVRTAAPSAIARLMVNPAGKLVLRSDVARMQRNTGVALAPGWSHLELCADVAAGSLRLIEDGSEISAWNVDLGANAIGEFQLGESQKRTFAAWIDTVAVDPVD